MADKWYVVGEGWTDEIKSRCQDRCGELYGDPPCYELGESGLVGGAVEYITPCADCLATPLKEDK